MDCDVTDGAGVHFGGCKTASGEIPIPARFEHNTGPVRI